MAWFPPISQQELLKPSKTRSRRSLERSEQQEMVGDEICPPVYTWYTYSLSWWFISDEGWYNWPFWNTIWLYIYIYIWIFNDFYGYWHEASCRKVMPKGFVASFRPSSTVAICIGWCRVDTWIKWPKLGLLHYLVILYFHMDYKNPWKLTNKKGTLRLWIWVPKLGWDAANYRVRCVTGWPFVGNEGSFIPIITMYGFIPSFPTKGHPGESLSTNKFQVKLFSSFKWAVSTSNGNNLHGRDYE